MAKRTDQRTIKVGQRTLGRRWLTRSWYNTDYMIVNGLLIPGGALSAIDDLIGIGRYQNLEEAVREGLAIVIDENAPSLIRANKYWLRGLAGLKKIFSDTDKAKPDSDGLRNLNHLQEMYTAISRESE